jgi:hypothetical protein
MCHPRKQRTGLTEPQVELDYVGPTRETDQQKGLLKGTGGTELVRFLKSVRDQTKSALMTLLNTKEDTERYYYHSTFYP